MTVGPLAVTADAEPGASALEPPAPLGRKATIQLVARTARVGTSTVSRCLNGGYVSAQARARVAQAMRELNYAPSFAARSLKARRTGRIGVVCASVQSAGFSQILAGIEERLAHTGQSVLLASLVQRGQGGASVQGAQGDASRCSGHPGASAVADWIRERRIDGLIFVGYTTREHTLLAAADGAGVPVVLIAPGVLAPDHCSVRCDDVQGGRLMAEHLLGCGHRRIAFVAGPHDSMDTRDRLAGLREALARGDAELCVDGAPDAFGDEYAAGAAYARTFLKRAVEGRPTAVVLDQDLMALGFLRSLLEHGLEVPRELSVAGFGGIPLGALYHPGLTTVAPPAQPMGAAGCSALLDRIDGMPLMANASVPQAVTLVPRESTAPPRDGVVGSRQPEER